MYILEVLYPGHAKLFILYYSLFLRSMEAFRALATICHSGAGVISRLAAQIALRVICFVFPVNYLEGSRHKTLRYLKVCGAPGRARG